MTIKLNPDAEAEIVRLLADNDDWGHQDCELCEAARDPAGKLRLAMLWAYSDAAWCFPSENPRYKSDEAIEIQARAGESLIVTPNRKKQWPMPVEKSTN